MQQYLLNATAIWLISLVLFDVFLRRESYHGYNRLYLLFTFLLGALLPLWQWQDDSRIISATLQRPLQQVISAKQGIISATAPAAAFNWSLWLMVIYLTGTVVALCALAIDVARLITFYHGSSKSAQDGWTVAETGKGHAPFSFRNILFVSTREQYTADEWRMILVHEKRHTALFHFIDLLLLQAGRIIFWFHPLVHVYNKRLLLVHEYQADNAAAQQPQAYGAFLIAQALLQAAPSVTHSFNRSPIKKRIVMLTRTSSAASRFRMLVFIPVALVSVACFSKSGFSQKFTRNGNFVTYKGNRFELSKPYTDTQIITDPISGQEFTKYIEHSPAPIKMNGVPIPHEVDKYPYFKGNDKNFRAYLLKRLENELSELSDGEYTLSIHDVLVGEKGDIVYFDAPDIHRYFTNDEILKWPQPGKQKPMPDHDGISKGVRENISGKAGKVMDNAALFLPAQLNGKPVVTWITDDYQLSDRFKVKNHKLYDRNKVNEWVPL